MGIGIGWGMDMDCGGIGCGGIGMGIFRGLPPTENMTVGCLPLAILFWVPGGGGGDIWAG